MAYIIRILEMYICSAVPSALCMWVLYKVPNITLWKVLCFIAFGLCLIANIWFWYDFIAHTDNNDKEFYPVNIVAFIAFMAGSVCLYKFSNAQLYSIVYTSTRPFEMWGLQTKVSAAIVFGIMAVFMVLTKLFSARLFGIRVTGEELNSLMMEDPEDESITLHNIRLKKENMNEQEETDEESD